MSPVATAEIDDPVLKAFASTVGDDDDGPVTVRGGQTRWDLGGPIDPAARLVSAPTGIVDYQPAEMTVRVRAGTTVAELNAALAERGQRSAVPDRGGTVGGAFAVGENDLRMLGVGRIRDALLQVRFVSAGGELVTGGGTTVKNVSGFDLPRLMVGSLGTLGLMAETLIRTNPAPDHAITLRSETADPFAVLDTVLRPSTVLWDGTSTWVELEGHRAEVDDERAKLGRLGVFAESEVPTLPPHRWSLIPSELASLRHAPSPTARPIGRFVALVGVGLVWAEHPQPARPVDAGVALLHTRMKEQFDPTGRLNPGRSPEVR